MRTRPMLLLLSAAPALLASGCGPADGVSSMAFALSAAQNLALPPAADLGVDVTPDDFALATGTCTITTATRKMVCSFTGLPSVEVTIPGPEYHVVLGIGPHPVTAQTYGHTHPAVSTVDLGLLNPSKIYLVPGRLSNTFTVPADAALDHTSGGTLDVVMPAAAGAGARHFVVLEGTIGNLPTGGASTPSPAGPVHMH